MLILVADDDPAVRDSLRRSLAFNGYEVSTASDGQAALDAVRDSRPDLLLLDVNMPTLDGLEICRRLRASGDDLPVLMLTARVEVGDRVLGPRRRSRRLPAQAVRARGAAGPDQGAAPSFALEPEESD